MISLKDKIRALRRIVDSRTTDSRHSPIKQAWRDACATPGPETETYKLQEARARIARLEARLAREEAEKAAAQLQAAEAKREARSKEQAVQRLEAGRSAAVGKPVPAVTMTTERKITREEDRREPGDRDHAEAEPKEPGGTKDEASGS
jgi:chromosome segregation ATPase